MKKVIGVLIVGIWSVLSLFGQSCGVDSDWFQNQMKGFNPNVPLTDKLREIFGKLSEIDSKN